MNLKVEDKVRFSTSFLRSIGCFLGEMPLAKGSIKKIKVLEAGCILAEIEWQNYDGSRKVNIKNLEKIK